MGGKAKPTKHTAKEIQGKHHAAKMRAGGCGGGQSGKAKRVAPKQGKKDVYIKCQKCFTMQPSIKSMQIHYDAKHPKQNWAEALAFYNKQEEEQQQVEKHQNKYDVDYQEYQDNQEGQKKEEQ